jgi:hypothetical protein
MVRDKRAATSPLPLMALDGEGSGVGEGQGNGKCDPRQFGKCPNIGAGETPEWNREGDHVGSPHP